MAKRTSPKSPGGVLALSRPSPNRKINMRVTDKTQTFYINNAAVEASTWDVKIRFGLLQGVSDDSVDIADVAHVYMTHEHAKAFVASLINGLQAFEQLRAKTQAAEEEAKH